MQSASPGPVASFGPARRLIPLARALALLLIAGATVAAPPVLTEPPPGTRLVDMAEMSGASSAATPLAGRWKMLWTTDPATLRDEFEQAPPLSAEAALADVLDHLSAQLEHLDLDAVDRLLESLDDVGVRVYVAHDESSRPVLLPAFDPPGRVESLRLLVHSLRQRRQFSADLVADTEAAVRGAAGLGEREGRAFSAALTLAPAHVLDVAARVALSDPTGVASWRVLLDQRPSAALYREAASQLAPGELLPLLPLAAARLPAPNALDWLESLTAEPQLASAAVLQIGALAGTYPAAESSLVARLDSAALGSSAASALVRLPGDPVARIERIIRQKNDAAPGSRALLHLALALRLEGSSEADRALQTLLQDPRLPATAKRELVP